MQRLQELQQLHESVHLSMVRGEGAQAREKKEEQRRTHPCWHPRRVASSVSLSLSVPPSVACRCDYGDGSCQDYPTGTCWGRKRVFSSQCPNDFTAGAIGQKGNSEARHKHAVRDSERASERANSFAAHIVVDFFSQLVL